MQTKANELVNTDAAAARSSPCHVFDKQFQSKCCQQKRKRRTEHMTAQIFNTRTQNANKN